MRKARTLLCAALIALLLLLLALPVPAAEYTYTVRLFTGSRGTVGGQTEVVYSGLHYGDRITFRVEDVQVTDGKYYVRGFRESGRDNDTVDAPSFPVTSDRDYVVAYGVIGAQVAYTVRYLDENGRELAPDDTFYGNVGDKPVVGFRYFDGYVPQHYNLTKTLSENAAENVFPFYYVRLSDQPGGTGTVPGGNPGGSGEGGSGSEQPPSESGTEPTGEWTGETDPPYPYHPGEEIIDLDPPLVNPNQEASGSQPTWALILKIAFGVLLGLLLLLLLFLFFKKRKKDE